MAKTYAGIDPGAKGAMVFLGPPLDIQDLPYCDGYVDVVAVFHWLRTLPPDCMAIVERQTKQGGARTVRTATGWATRPANVATVATQFQNYGALRAVLTLEGHPFEEVPAAQWKKTMGLSSDKTQSIDAARRLWPDVNWLASKDGRAEAALLAEYGRRKGL
jgi:hypothetical protein